jgi:NADPH:quinone reductase-like Zn-dependent oxidoreductase
VDFVLDVGGSSTIKQSIASVRLGGSIAVSGILGEGDESGLAPAIMYKAVRGMLLCSVTKSLF